MEPETPLQGEVSPGDVFARLRTFLVEVRNELKRVNWPSGREVYATTVVVLVFSIALGVYLRAVEAVFDWFLLWLFTRFGVRYP
jgi:preprotein translocase subunit SecE